jgi:SAM-dependent methyltransferase
MKIVDKTPTLGEAALAWWRELIARGGVVRGCGIALSSMWELAIDYLPSRKRLRYGDIDFDFEHGVNTTWAQPSLAVRLREVFTRGKYQPSEPGLFHQILDELQVSFERFTFVDLGSGKGRTLLMASDYPFRRIIGAEIIPELHAVAQENIRRYHSDRQKCFTLEAWMGDAREFPFPSEPTVVYLFNPFPADILGEMLERLRLSLRERPREMYVIYHNLVHEEMFRQATWLQPIHRTAQFVIYRSSYGH